MPLRETLTNTWDHIQGFLFPRLREEIGPLTAQHERLVIVLEVARIEAFVQMWPGLPGRPPQDRHALARAPGLRLGDHLAFFRPALALRRRGGGGHRSHRLLARRDGGGVTR